MLSVTNVGCPNYNYVALYHIADCRMLWVSQYYYYAVSHFAECQYAVIHICCMSKLRILC
jgi:hypothetical protein